jgi:hypothetical protein
LREECGDAGKARVQVDTAYVAHVEIDQPGLLRIGADAFTGDGAGYDVARREFEAGMVALHETLAAVVAQNCAFATEGFGEQETGRTGLRERSGMELVELHVGELGSGRGRNGNAVSGSHRGVGGVGIDLPGASRGDEDAARGDGTGAVVAIEQPNAGDAVVLSEQAGNGGPLGEADRGVGTRDGSKGTADLGARGVAVGVKNTRTGVRSFAGAKEVRAFVVEAGSPGDKFFDTRGTFADEHFGGGTMDEPVARGKGVVEVKRDVLVAFHCDGDAALRVVRVGFGDRFLSDDEDLAALSQFYCGTQSSHARTDNEIVNLHS